MKFLIVALIIALLTSQGNSVDTWADYEDCLYYDVGTEPTSVQNGEDCDWWGEFQDDACQYVDSHYYGDYEAWDNTFYDNFLQCLDATYSWTYYECNQDTDAENYYLDIADFCFGETSLNQNYFASSTDYYPYDQQETATTYESCLNNLYSSSTLEDNKIDKIDYFNVVQQTNLSDACYYVDQNYDQVWNNKFQRIFEMCWDDILDWAYNEVIADQFQMEYLEDQAYCLEQYIPIDPAEFAFEDSFNSGYPTSSTQSCDGFPTGNEKMTFEMWDDCIYTVTNGLETAGTTQEYLDCEIESYGSQNRGCQYIAKESNGPLCDYTEWSTTYGKYFYECQYFFYEKSKSLCSANAQAAFEKIYKCVDFYSKYSTVSSQILQQALGMFLVLAITFLF